MKKNLNSCYSGLLAGIFLIVTFVTNAQTNKSFIKKYLEKLPKVQVTGQPQRFRMSAVYTNQDIFGNFKGKTRMTGEYTSGLPGDSAIWNNVFLSASDSETEPFTEGKKLNYIESFKYLPAPEMVTEKEAFKNFPSTPENVFARNMIWDMYSFEIFAWKFYDSLKLNKPYIVNEPGQFNMAEIGKYSHSKMIFTWVGVTTINDELCSVIEFTTPDNRLELEMDMVKTKGTEQYWGTVFVSTKSKSIEKGIMYSGTIQQIEVKGMKDSFLMKTIRELEIERIQ
jgi:hypothetical protein